MPPRLIDEELDLLARVRSSLASLPPAKTASEAPILRELDRLREVMLSGEEVKDLSALTAQWHQQASLLQQLRGARGGAVVDPGSPYFGHLRIREKEREWDICLGHGTCIERGVRIVDWRDAPISRLFYSYQQGDEYDEEIAGRDREGEVVVRRMVRIRGGRLERIQAPEGDFVADPTLGGGWRREQRRVPRLSGGEAAALRAYSPGNETGRRLGSDLQGAHRPADKRLPEITGLIDPDQFELITRPSAGFLVIRGAAGSGKTTVALHRVAYLAFDDPAVDGPDTLVAVFSDALRDYVGHVLPSLGLQAVAIVTYRDWIRDTRLRHFPRLPRKERETTPAFVQRMKLHPWMDACLRAHVASEPGEPTWEQAVDDWASVLTQGRLLREQARIASTPPFNEAEIDRFTRWNRERIDELQAFLAGDTSGAPELDPEDDVLLLRAWQLRVGPLRAEGRRPLRYRHVVLDEVQDFSPLEVLILLGCLDPSSSITLAGDTQQHLVDNSGFTSWSEFFHHLGVSGRAIDTLRVNYRSSLEIARFAHSVLGELREEESVPDCTRSGPPVELFRFSDRGACALFLADALRELASAEPLASVAILTPSAAASDAYHSALERSDLPRLRRVGQQGFTFTAGIEVTEIERAKGLEFDYVVIVDADSESFPVSPSARRRLHVAATRAVHQLWLTCVGTPSTLLGELDCT